MNKFNLMLRDKSSTLLLIIGLSLSFFVAVNVLALLNSIEDAKKGHNKYAYDREYYFDYIANDESEEDDDVNDVLEAYYENFENMLEGMKGKEGNLFLYGYFFFLGDGLQNPCTYVMLSATEELSQEFVWGRAISKEEVHNNERVVMVGNNKEKLIQEENGEKYIIMDSTRYKVVGIYQNKYNLNQINRMDICTYYDCLSDTAKETIKFDRADFVLQFLYGSSKMDSDKMEANMAEWENHAEENGYGMEFHEEEKDEENQKLLNAKSQFNKIFMYMTFIFTLFNCIVISDIWLKRRYNEFVIRRTFGYSMTDMAKLLVKDIFVYALFALAVGAAVQGIYSSVLGKSGVNPEYIINNALFLAAVVIVVIAATVAVPLIQIRKILPAEQIRKQKR